MKYLKNYGVSKMSSNDLSTVDGGTFEWTIIDTLIDWWGKYGGFTDREGAQI